MKCAVCKNYLKSNNIVKLKNNDKLKLIGINMFCINKDCKYEKDYRLYELGG